MTFYTDRISQRSSVDIFELEPSTGEVAEAAFDQASFENPSTALQRISELAQAEEGALEQRLGMGGGLVLREPDSPLLTQAEAKARMKELGIDIQIPKEGIRERSLDILTERHQEDAKRQFILGNAPKGTMPLQLLSSFAAQLTDPLNIATAFVPVVRESKYSAMLARASTPLGRAGVRAGVGATEGAVGTAMLEPLILGASKQDQTDYSMYDSMLNIAFGTVIGGGLHTTGGLISDIRNKALIEKTPDAKVFEEPDEIPESLPTTEPAESLSPKLQQPTLREIIQKQTEADFKVATGIAESKAIDELIPQLKQELQEIQQGRLPNVGDLKKEVRQIDSRLANIDDTFKARAKELQSQGNSRKRAETLARKNIEEERKALQERQADVAAALEQNRQAELAKSDEVKLLKGEVPERFKDRVRSRADEIKAGFEKKPLYEAIEGTARHRAEMAPNYAQENALKSAVASLSRGQRPDVRAELGEIKDLSKVQEKEDLTIKEYESFAERASEAIKTYKDDLSELDNQLEFDTDTAARLKEQLGLDEDPDLKDLEAFEQQAEKYSKAWDAAALCFVRSQ